MKKVFIFLLILIVLLVGGAYAMVSMEKEVDVTWNEQDFNSAVQKSQVEIAEIEEINLVTLAKNDFTISGTNEVEAKFSNAEMSALIDKANANGGPISDFKVAFNGNDEGEISFKLTDSFIRFIEDQNIISLPNNAHAFNYFISPLASTSGIKDTIVKFITGVAVNKPVYASGSLIKVSENSVSLNITSLKVGQISMSQDVIDKVEYETLRFVNGLLSEVNGISIEELRVENGELYYKGTLPAEIKGVKIK